MGTQNYVGENNEGRVGLAHPRQRFVLSLKYRIAHTIDQRNHKRNKKRDSEFS
jgi:hypothetical protein